MNPDAVDQKHRLELSLRRLAQEAERGEIPLDRYRCRYLRWGRGPNLILIHGLADQARSFAMLMAELAADFTCTAYELAGDGRDLAVIGRYHHSEYVGDLFNLLDHFEIHSTSILGSSFGSTVALAAMRKDPQRITHGILQGGFARRPLKRFEKCLAQLVRYCPGRMEDVPGRSRILDPLDRRAFENTHTDVYHFFRDCAGKTPLSTAARRALILRQVDLRQILAEIPQPVLMIGGDCDAIVPREFEQEVQNGLGNVRRLEIPRCGHYPQYTHPCEMADEIRRFLLGNRGPDGVAKKSP